MKCSRFLQKKRNVQIYLSDDKNVISIVNKIPAIPCQCVQWHHRVYGGNLDGH